MKRRLIPVLAVLCVLGAAGETHAQSGPPDLSSFRVTRPGIVLADPSARREELARWPAGLRDRACRAVLYPRPRAFTTVRDIALLEDRSLDIRARPFVYYVMEVSAHAMALDDSARAEEIKDALVAWARDGALSDWQGSSHPNVYASLDANLLPLIAAAGLVRARFNEREFRDLRDWLRALIVRHEGPRDCFTCERDGYRNLRDAVNMAYGALTGDDHYYRLGVARYLAAVASLRPDGAFPTESGKQEFVLWDTSRAIAPLIAIAEMARAQGQDLYSLTRHGRGIQHAVLFLLRNLDGLDDGGRLRRLDDPAIGVRERQNTGFLYPDGLRSHSLAWAEAFVARFPAHPAARQLRALFAGGRAVGHEALIHARIGGNASCLFAASDALVP